MPQQPPRNRSQGSRRQSSSPPPGPIESEAPAGPVERILSLLITQGFSLLRRVVSVADYRVLIALTGAFVAYVWALPPADRKNAGLGRLIDAVSGSAGATLMMLGGWALCAILLAVGGLFGYFAWRRVQAQGKELQRLRKERDPNRLSSQNAQELAEYSKRSTTGLRIDTAPPPAPADPVAEEAPGGVKPRLDERREE